MLNLVAAAPGWYVVLKDKPEWHPLLAWKAILSPVPGVPRMVPVTLQVFDWTDKGWAVIDPSGVTYLADGERLEDFSYLAKKWGPLPQTAPAE
jgi:hypothetical protein